MSGSKKARLVIFWLAAGLFYAGTVFAQPDPVGLWEFDDPNDLLKATIGEPLELVGDHSAIQGMSATDGAVNIGTGSYYVAWHTIAPNGGGSYVNQYSLVYDFRLPELGVWYSFYNTNATNTNDGDGWINPTGNVGVGATGYSAFAVSAGEWYRLAIVLDLAAGTIDYYVNGRLVQHGTGQSLDGRFSMYSVNDNTPYVLLFADDNGEDSPIDVSMVALYDRALTADDVAALLGPGGTEPPPVAGEPPATPSISVSPPDPSGVDDVTLTGSPFSSPTGARHVKSVWQVALDQEFTNLLVVHDSTTDLTSFVVENDRFPFGKTFYARVQYADADGNSSDFSAPVSFVLNPPAGLQLIFSEDFEAVPDGALPQGWSEVSFTEGGGNVELATWVVYPLEFFQALEYYPHYEATPPTIFDTDVLPIVEGKSCQANSGDYGAPYFEAHLFSPVIDLTGVTNVILTFNSDYLQNQDNIAVLEYTLESGGLDQDWMGTWTWLPIAYLLDPPDIRLDEQGNIDGEATLAPDNIADGTDYAYGDYVFAARTTPAADLAAYIFPRLNDDPADGRRFEKYRLPAADNQPSVRIRWMMMGTWSWYWGIDNVQIWGISAVGVTDWSIY